MAQASTLDTDGVVHQRTRPPVDLTNVLTADWQDPGIRIELSWRLRLGSPGVWGATISKRRWGKSDREVKPTHLLTIVGDPGGTPSDLLRTLAVILEQTEPIEYVD